MRQITSIAADHFHTGIKWKRDNTEVTVEGEVVKLWLHGNCIAQKTPLTYTITNCGWFTNTTKERLNGLNRVSIVQKKGKWFLNNKEWDGGDTILGAFGVWE